MQFDSLAAFIDMAGHGQYVWMAYAITLGTWLGLVIAPMLKRKRLIRAILLAKSLEE